MRDKALARLMPAVFVPCALTLLLLSFRVTAPAEARAAADEVKRLAVTALGVNTSGDEDEPHVADNGLTLYYVGKNKEGKEDILFVRRRAATLAWPAKGKVIEDYVSTAADDRSVFATQGAYPHYLFFATKKDKKAGNFDIFVAGKDGAGKAWSAVRPVANVNTPEDELHPWVSGDGKSLYFSRKTEDGWRVYVSQRSMTRGPGGWQEPEAVGLPAGFHHATLSPDGKTMYLQGPLEKGRRWGLFVSTRSGARVTSDWSKPVALEGLNHPEGKTGDRSPNLSRDGQWLYFASDRPGGKGGLDLYTIRTALLAKKK